MTERNLDSIGWGIFFIWIGICSIAGFSFAVGLLGVGIITLGVQFARRFSNLKFEGFWFFAGILFLIGGLFGLFRIEFDLIPIILIAAGVLLLFSVIGRKKSAEQI